MLKVGKSEDWVTIDWDDWEWAEAAGWLNWIWNQYPFAEIFYRSSPGGKGYHVRIEFPHTLSQDFRFEVRVRCQDDKRRIEYDKIRVQGEAVVDYSHGVLFDKNGAKLAGEWEKYGP